MLAINSKMIVAYYGLVYLFPFHHAIYSTLSFTLFNPTTRHHSMTPTFLHASHPLFNPKQQRPNHQKVLYGSIYAPNGKDEDHKDDDTNTTTNATERDHLGMKRSSKEDQPIASWASSSSSSSSSSPPVASSSSTNNTIQQAVEDAVLQASTLQQQQQQQQKVSVRFINFDTMGGLEKVSSVSPGMNILKIADEIGIRIPRQCRTGLCGSCTADVKDPTWIDGERIGFQTIRTCQAGAMLPAGCDEMVIDLYRMARDSDTSPTILSENTSNPPRLPNNFEDGWEADFKPDYKTGRSSSSTTASNRPGSSGVALERGSTGGVQVLKNTTPEYIVKQGKASSIEIDKPHWTPRIDANIPPWETIW